MTHTLPSSEARGRGTLGAIGVLYLLLFITGAILTVRLTRGAPFPNPYGPVEVSHAYYLQHSGVVGLGACLQFFSAMLLGIWTSGIAGRMRSLELPVVGIEIARFGGHTAAVFLALSSFSGWILAQPGLAAEPGVMRALQLLAFIAGGVGYVAPLGVLLAAISLSVLPAGLLPRWVSLFGCVIGVIACCSALSLVLPAVSVLLPLGRFPAFIWIIFTGFLLSRGHRGAAP